MSKEKKNNLNTVINIMKNINPRYAGAAAVMIAIIVILCTAVGSHSFAKSPSTEGATKQYSENVSEEIQVLVNTYYDAYSRGDIDTLVSVADPISDQELSYIGFYSQYIESIDNIKLYTKPGATEDATIVSAYIEMNYLDANTAAPGLDFLYIRKNDEGKLFIDNLYGSFNQTNGIYELDPDVANFIAVFEQQEDVITLQKQVQQACNDAFLNDDTLSNFVNVKFKEAVITWSTNYKTIAAEAELEQQQEALKAEEEAKKAEEEAAKKAEEANAFTGTVNEKVNVRSEASKDSTKVGAIDKGTKITIYAKEGDWYKFKYSDAVDRAYIKAEFVDVAEASDDTSDSENNSENNSDNSSNNSSANNNNSSSNNSSANNSDSNSNSNNSNNSNNNNNNSDSNNESSNSSGSLTAGKDIYLPTTCNIRSSMSEDASKVAVAYQGEKVTIVQEYADGWTKVKYDGKEGYIKTSLLKN